MATVQCNGQDIVVHPVSVDIQEWSDFFDWNDLEQDVPRPKPNRHDCIPNRPLLEDELTFVLTPKHFKFAKYSSSKVWVNEDGTPLNDMWKYHMVISKEKTGKTAKFCSECNQVMGTTTLCYNDQIIQEEDDKRAEWENGELEKTLREQFKHRMGREYGQPFTEEEKSAVRKELEKDFSTCFMTSSYRQSGDGSMSPEESQKHKNFVESRIKAVLLRTAFSERENVPIIVYMTSREWDEEKKEIVWRDHRMAPHSPNYVPIHEEIFYIPEGGAIKREGVQHLDIEI
jgi:hypothetical protein